MKKQSVKDFLTKQVSSRNLKMREFVHTKGISNCTGKWTIYKDIISNKYHYKDWQQTTKLQWQNKISKTWIHSLWTCLFRNCKKNFWLHTLTSHHENSRYHESHQSRRCSRRKKYWQTGILWGLNTNEI